MGRNKLVSTPSFEHDTRKDEVADEHRPEGKELKGTRGESNSIQMRDRRVKLDIVTLSILYFVLFNHLTHIVLLVSGTRSHGRAV